MTLTPLEVSLVAVIVGVGGWLGRSLFEGKTFVKKDICRVIHTNLDKTLERIERKIDQINNGGGKKNG